MFDVVIYDINGQKYTFSCDRWEITEDSFIFYKHGDIYSVFIKKNVIGVGLPDL